MTLDEIHQDLITQPLNAVKVHQKVESLVKVAEKTFEHYDSQIARSVVWMSYAISAIFCGMCNILKARLKFIFKNEIRYSDGDTLQEMAQWFSQFKDVTFLTGTDISSMDMQVDDQMLQLENYVLLQMGWHPDIANLYLRLHYMWRFKTKY